MLCIGHDGTNMSTLYTAQLCCRPPVRRPMGQSASQVPPYLNPDSQQLRHCCPQRVASNSDGPAAPLDLLLHSCTQPTFPQPVCGSLEPKGNFAWAIGRRRRDLVVGQICVVSKSSSGGSISKDVMKP